MKSLTLMKKILSQPNSPFVAPTKTLDAIQSTYQVITKQSKNVQTRNFVSGTHGVTPEQLAEAKAQVTNSTRKIVDNVVTNINKANHIFDDRTVALDQRVTALEKQLTENTLKQAGITDTTADLKDEVQGINRLAWNANFKASDNSIQNFVNIVSGGVIAFLGFKNFQLSKRVTQLEKQNQSTDDHSPIVNDAMPGLSVKTGK